MSVRTDAVTKLGAYSATLNGTLEDLQGNNSLDVYFQYGYDTSYGHTTPPQTLSSTSSFSQYLSLPESETEYHLRAVATDGSNYWYGDNTVITTISSTVYDFEGDTPFADFSFEGDAHWFQQSDVVYEGSYAAQSGDITHDQTSELVYNAPFDGLVSFYWKVSCEVDYDSLRFYINGNQQAEISGKPDWDQLSYTISEGDELRWAYEKDSSTSDYNDCGYLDNVVIGSDENFLDGSFAHESELPYDETGSVLQTSPILDASFFTPEFSAITATQNILDTYFYFHLKNVTLDAVLGPSNILDAEFNKTPYGEPALTASETREHKYLDASFTRASLEASVYCRIDLDTEFSKPDYLFRSGSSLDAGWAEDPFVDDFFIHAIEVRPFSLAKAFKRSKLATESAAALDAGFSPASIDSKPYSRFFGLLSGATFSGKAAAKLESLFSSIQITATLGKPSFEAEFSQPSVEISTGAIAKLEAWGPESDLHLNHLGLGQNEMKLESEFGEHDVYGVHVGRFASTMEVEMADAYLEALQLLDTMMFSKSKMYGSLSQERADKILRYEKET